MFFDNFQRLCALVGKKPNAVAKDLSISSGSVTAWKNGRIPGAHYLQSLAAYFTEQLCRTITVNDLLAEDSAQGQSPVYSLTEREQLALRLFNDISEKDQNSIISLMESLKKQ